MMELPVKVLEHVLVAFLCVHYFLEKKKKIHIDSQKSTLFVVCLMCHHRQKPASKQYLPQSPTQHNGISASAKEIQKKKRFSFRHTGDENLLDNILNRRSEQFLPSYLQGAHGQSGDGLTLGHHGVHGLERVLQAAVGDVRLAGHVVDVLDGRVSL